MQAKLTLRMDEELVEQAKAHAQEQGKSLSKMVADYFRLLMLVGSEAAEKPVKVVPENKLPPITASLVGILAHVEEYQERSDKEIYHDYLQEKYG